MEKDKNILPRDAASSDVKNSLDGAKQGDSDRPKATGGSKGKSWGLKQPVSLMAGADDSGGWKGECESFPDVRCAALGVRQLM